MLAEHTFITTLADDEALERGQRLLERLDFEVESRLPHELTARRGKKAPHRGPVDRLPQRVKMELDRGRVVLAASIEPHGKPRQIHQDLLLAIARYLEANLVRGDGSSEAFDELTAVQQRIENDSHHRRVGVIIILVVLAIIWLFMIVVVWMASQ